MMVTDSSRKHEGGEVTLQRRVMLKAALQLGLGYTVLNSAAVTSDTKPLGLSMSDQSGCSDMPHGALYISAARRSENNYEGIIFNAQAERIAAIPLQSRAHGAASHAATGRVCLFSRRPGIHLYAFTRSQPEKVQLVQSAGGRHFYGHGAYSSNGELLYATENDYDQARGLLGVYAAGKDYSRIGEIETHGIGPHDIVRVPNSPWLLVANGGIQTHPDSGREKLNLDTMQPSLVLIDARNGELVAKHVLPDELHRLSLRHLACTQDGDIWFAGQYESSETMAPYLAGVISVRRSVESYVNGFSCAGLTLLELPAEVRDRAKNYLSSIALAGNQVILTSSHGGLVLSVDRQNHELIDTLSMLDCSGVAGDATGSGCFELETTEFGNGAMLTSGTGEIARMSEMGLSTLGMFSEQWDNHAYRI